MEIGDSTQARIKIIHLKLEKTGITRFSSILTEKIWGEKIEEFRNILVS
ncbi:MAG: hypothetical protein HYT97_03265 [Elusimicrobia bacterium]|nr:hypothetical protein [Elusimicrobiota bacterium]